MIKTTMLELFANGFDSNRGTGRTTSMITKAILEARAGRCRIILLFHTYQLSRSLYIRDIITRVSLEEDAGGTWFPFQNEMRFINGSIIAIRSIDELKKERGSDLKIPVYIDNSIVGV